MSRIDELQAELCADAALWWELRERMPATLGPWDTTVPKGRIGLVGVPEAALLEYKARRYAGGRVAAQVDHWSHGPFYTSIRSEENPEWGMVDFRHEVSSFQEGMDLVDAELRRLGYLLVV